MGTSYLVSNVLAVNVTLQVMALQTNTTGGGGFFFRGNQPMGLDLATPNMGMCMM
jgi:hypothetical protein